MKKVVSAICAALAISWLCAPIQASAQQIDPAARGLAAAAYAAATGAGPSSTTFATKAAAQAATLVGVNGFSTLAFATAGDGGGADWIKATDSQIFTCDIVTANSIRYHPVSDIDPRICGAKPDLVTVANVDMSGSTINVHSSSISTYGWTGFVSTDVGKKFAVGGAGPAVAATGIIRVSAKPAANDTCTINGQAETAKTSGAVAHQFNIGTGQNETATALAAVITTDTTTTGVTAVAVYNEVRLTANSTGTGGNAITLACSSGTPDTPKMEALQTFMAGGAANSELVGSITAVTSNHTATSSVPVSFSVSSSYMDFGTDNATALTNALELSGGIDATDQQHFFTSGYYWGRGGQGVSVNGPRRIVMRCYGRPNCVYGVGSEITLTTGTTIDFQEDATLGALPGFSGDAIVGTAQDSSTYHVRANNLHVDAHRRVANGMWFRSCTSCSFTGITHAQNAERIGIHLGSSEANGQSDRAIVNHFDHAYVTGQTGGNFGPTGNNPAGYALQMDDNSADQTFDVFEGVCYRHGYINLGSAVNVGTGHVWTGTCGPMNVGYDLRSGSDHFNVLYADTPSNDITDPTSVSAVGMLVRSRTMADKAHCFINVGSASEVDNDVTCVSVVYIGASGSMVWSDLQVATSSSSIKYKAAVSYAAAEAVSISNGLKARQNFNVRRVGLPSSTAYTLGYVSEDQLLEGPTFIPGATQYYPLPGVATLSNGVALSNANLYLWLTCLKRPTQVSRFVARVSTLDAAPGHFQFYVYAADTTTTGWPPTGTPLAQSADVSESSATTITFDPSGNLLMGAGCYWVGGQQDGSVAALTSLSSSSLQQQYLIGSTSTSSLGASSVTAGRSYVNTYGVAKDLTGVSGTDLTSAQAPMVWFRPQ